MAALSATQNGTDLNGLPVQQRPRTVNDFQTWAQGRYGRQASQQELQQIGQHVGYNGQGDISDDQFNRAQQYSDQLAQQQGWRMPATATPTTPNTPGPGVQAPVVGPARPPSQMDLAAQERIQMLLGRNTGTVDTGDPAYQAQLGAFKRNQQRGMERSKNMAAERAAAGGVANTGGFEASQQAMDTGAANALGQFESGLMGQQLGQQREDLQMGLQLAQQRGLTDQAQGLQERLANLSTQMQQQGLNLQGELGRGDLNLRNYLGRGQLGLGLLGTLLGDQQSRNALGFNYASLGNQINQQTLQQLLAGL